ncbi:MAG: Ig-like domain-containing protein [Deltaproteobacteria bacterium]|nr:Ig-like domain-containing protein [Deltaproteobacteria bacterium]
MQPSHRRSPFTAQFGFYLAALAAGWILACAKPATPPLPPVSDAGLDQIVRVGAEVILDGSGSHSRNGAAAVALAFEWSVISTPAGSTASLSNIQAASPRVRVDVAGDYVFRLVVTEGGLQGLPDAVVVRGYRQLDVVAQTPQSGAYGVGPLAPVVVAFSEPLQPDTVTPSQLYVRAGHSVIPGYVGVEGGNLAVFTPLSAYPAGQEMTVVVTQRVASISGLTLPAAYQGRFIVATGADVQAPAVQQISPADGTEDASPTTAVVVAFDEPVDAASATADDDADGCPDHLPLFDSTSTCVAGTVTLGGGGTRATFAPQTSLVAGASYTIVATTAITDLALNPLLLETRASFTVTTAVDTTPPTVDAIYPGNDYQDAPIGARIAVTFSEAVAPATVTTGSVFVTQGSTPVAAAVTLAVDRRTAVLEAVALFSPSTSYTITVKGSGAAPVTDAGGTSLDGDRNGSPGGDSVTSFRTTATPTRSGSFTVPATISPGVTINVSLSDADLDRTVARDTVHVRARSSAGEQEDVTLLETLGRSGVFSGQLRTAFLVGAGTDNDATMNVVVGSVVTLEYLDELSAAGVQAYVRASVAAVSSGAAVIVSTISGDTSETGGTATFVVSLATQPTATTTVNLDSNDHAEGVVNKTSLVFTAATWSTPQLVTVTGVDDFVDDGDQAYAIVFAATASADPAYSGLTPATLDLFNVDNDVVGINVSAAVGSTTEAGGTATFTIVLATQPSADVTVFFDSDTPSEGTVSSTSLTFTTSDWASVRTVTMTGVNDSIDDGNQTYNIVFTPTASADSAYDTLTPAGVLVTNVDNDTAGYVVFPTGVSTSENGATAIFTIKLLSEPTADVVVSFDSNDLGEGTVSATSLTFTALNWSSTQSVTVTGVNDTAQDGNQTYAIAFALTASSDALYAAIKPADIGATNLEVGSNGVPAIVQTSFTLGTGISVRMNGDTDEYTNLTVTPGDDAVSVTLTTSIDTETVTLAESLTTAGAFDCSFGGCFVRTAEAGTGTNGNGILEAVADDIVTLSYTDPMRDNGTTGVNATDTATALAASCVNVVINEVVVDPKQDWSGSGFTNPAGGGTIDAGDQWIELENLGCVVDLTTEGLKLVMSDATPYTYDFVTDDGQVLVFSAGSATNFPTGAYLAIGLPAGSGSMTTDVWVHLDWMQAGGTAIADEVALGNSVGGDGDGANNIAGTATDTTDEAARRNPDGTGAFGKGAATIGAANP